MFFLLKGAGGQRRVQMNSHMKNALGDRVNTEDSGEHTVIWRSYENTWRLVGRFSENTGALVSIPLRGQEKVVLA